MRVDVSVAEARASNARASASSALAARPAAVPAPAVPANVFATAVAAGNAAVAVDGAVDTALDAGVADLDGRTTVAITLYEEMNVQNESALSC